MKTAVFLILAVFLSMTSARASGPTTIEITTTDEGVTYTVHDYDARIKNERQSPEEIEAWIRKYHPQRPDELVVVRPNDRTPFKTVLEFLLRLKNAEVKQYAIASDDGTDNHWVVGLTAKISSRKSEPAPAKK